MTLIERITRLFRADVHDLLDRIEEPSVVLKQAVRDMEQELSQEQQLLRKTQRDAEAIATRVQDIESTLKEIESQLGVCFDSAKEDLARRLIKKRLELENLHKQIARKKALVDENLARRLEGFEENRSRLEEIRQKAEILAVEGVEDGLNRENFHGCESLIREEDVEVCFLREKQLRSGS